MERVYYSSPTPTYKTVFNASTSPATRATVPAKLATSGHTVCRLLRVKMNRLVVSVIVTMRTVDWKLEPRYDVANNATGESTLHTLSTARTRDPYTEREREHRKKSCLSWGSNRGPLPHVQQKGRNQGMVSQNDTKKDIGRLRLSNVCCAAMTASNAASAGNCSRGPPP
jgi:hypothetical protein